MAEDKYNLKNPAVKRILQEVKEMQSNPSDEFMSLPLEVSLSSILTTLLFLLFLFCIMFLSDGGSCRIITSIQFQLLLSS